MPKFTRRTSSVDARQGIGLYDGPIPTPGTYPAIINNIAYRVFGSGTACLNVNFKLDAPDDSPKAQYNGYSDFAKVFLLDNDISLSRERALYEALGAAVDGDVVTGEGRAVGQGGTTDYPITRLNGLEAKKISGTRCYVQLRMEKASEVQEGYSARLVGDSIYPDPKWTREGGDAPAEAAPGKRTATKRTATKAAAAPAEPAADSVPAQQPATPQADPAPTEEQDEDYHGFNLPKLRKLAASKGINTDGLAKPALLEALDSLASEPEEGDSVGSEDDQGGYDISGYDPAQMQALSEQQPEIFWQAVWDQYAGGKDDVDGMSVTEVIEDLVETKKIKPF